MSIPDYTQLGLLPPGIHCADINEVKKRFAWNNARKKLFTGLLMAIAHLKAAGAQYIYLDGSFVTNKYFPNDYDCCYDPANVDPNKLDPVFFDFANGRAAQKLKYNGEFFPTQIHPKYQSMLPFFQEDKSTGLPKGIIRLKL